MQTMYFVNNKYGCMDQNDCWEILGIVESNELAYIYSGYWIWISKISSAFRLFSLSGVLTIKPSDLV